ncbi:hypothetical protein M9H77_18144 [Catharanthus roseus]|uniref:Uncharacterized protein n=1 Tax=Catharanthus roseus TaxID=4058 RepID=A0ACC0B6N2_CATRO|nr:hypothetical protein M9H77_18144 [Catharanthus roseus]
MGEHSHNRHKKKHRKVEYGSDSDSSFSLPTSLESLSSDDRIKKRRRSGDEKRHRKSSSTSDRKSRRDKKHKRTEKDRRRSHKSKREKSKKKKRDYSESDESGSESESDYERDGNFGQESPEEVVKCILEEFPTVAGDLEQLLHMIDDGQAVDISGLSEKSLVKRLRKLFVSLKLKEKGDNCFLLPSKVRPTLELVGAIIRSHGLRSQDGNSENKMQSVPADSSREVTNDAPVSDSHKEVGPARRRMFGPEMPSAELLAAAAKLTEAEAEMRYYSNVLIRIVFGYKK